MYDLQIIPPKETKGSEPMGCSPCCDSEKPRYPKLCLSGTARESFLEAVGEDAQVDDEYELQNVRVKVTGRTHNEYTNDIDLSVMSLEGVAESDDQSDEGESEKSVRKGK